MDTVLHMDLDGRGAELAATDVAADAHFLGLFHVASEESGGGGFFWDVAGRK